jgi:hypothetical protein
VPRICKAAESDDFVVLRFAGGGELLVDRLPLVGGHLEDFAFVLEKHHRRGGLGGSIGSDAIRGNYRGSGRVGHGDAVLQEMIAGHLLGIAAQQNVSAAAGHVGGHSDRAFAPGLCDHARFALVLLGVEYLVRDAGFFQNGGDGFGFFDRDGADKHRLAALVKVANAVRE